jgi:spore germination protein YaaH
MTRKSRYALGLVQSTGAALIALALLAPTAFAADVEVSGWMPYWRVSESIKDAKKHLDYVGTVHPFAFTVKSNGTLSDQAKLTKSNWKNFFKAADKADVDVVPTIMWADGAAIHATLSDESEREEHIEKIVAMVKKGKYAGIDIDYEAKWAETKDYFSMFLRELEEELGGKVLSCTIEARTPPASMYRDIPANIEYANDFAVIGKVCDRVNVMAYDQGRAVYAMNEANKGQPYSPVADLDWAREVMELAAQSIPKSKLYLGIPTYGYEYQVVVQPEWYSDYVRLWSFNPGYIEDMADDLDIEPYRTNAGEAGLTYFANGEDKKIPRSIKAPKGTPEGLQAAARALAYANQTGNTTSVNFATWNDGEAFAEKVELAEDLGLAGVAIFKIDGGEDQDIWDALED